MNTKLLLAATVSCLFAMPASAAIYTIDLTGTVSSGTTAQVDFMGNRFDFFSIVLQGLPQLTLEVGDEINATITLDQKLTVPSALVRNQVDFIILNSLNPTTTTTGTSGSTELFDGATLIASDASGSGSTNQVVNSYLNFAGTTFAFDKVFSNFTVTSLSDPTLAVDYPILRYVTVNPLAAVPEPSTWALMILGFGFIGSVLRRRQAVRVTYA